MRRDAAYRSMQLKFGQFVAIFRHLTSTSDSCSPVQIANQCLFFFFIIANQCPLKEFLSHPSKVGSFFPPCTLLLCAHYSGASFIAGCSGQFARTSIVAPRFVRYGLRETWTYNLMENKHLLFFSFPIAQVLAVRGAC